MRSPVLLLGLATALSALSGCTTTPPQPTAAAPVPLSSEYVVALGKILRTPEKNPLIDEGRVPLSALNIVAAYQNICLRGRYRDLLAFYDEPTRQAKGAQLENDFLRQEAIQPASLAVLTDVRLETSPMVSKEHIYTFSFTHPHRNGNSNTQLYVKVSADGVASIF